jgi:NADH-quinone oxidoreductase subunit C
MSDNLVYFATIEQRLNKKQVEFRAQPTLFIEVEQIHEALMILRDEFQFNMLLDVTAVDYWHQEPRFHVVYQLYSTTRNARLTLRVPVSGHKPQNPTASDLFPSANWYEREIWDLFGIHFDNHPDLRRLVMPADWEGHPLRKDYPLGYEEPQFTFNFEDISVHKLHPEK